MHSTDYSKGLKKAHSLIVRAQAELREHGYRENLGYGRHNELIDYLNSLSLSYKESAKILHVYEEGCDQL